MKTLIYGAGYGLERFVLDYLPDDNIEIVHVVDSDTSKQKKTICGYYIENPDVIKESNIDLILISAITDKYIEEIRNNIISKYSISANKIMSLKEIVTVCDITKLHVRDVEDKEPVKIYDCFKFYNELELLELRMELLGDIVDYFIVVEGTRTQQGKEKPLFFKLHIDRFKKWSDKIIHIVVDDCDVAANKKRIVNGFDWTIENAQRNGIIKGLRECNMNDIVIISDLDEFPRPEVLSEIRKQTMEKNGYYYNELENGAITLDTKMSYGYINAVCEKVWYGSTVQFFKKMSTPQRMRDFRSCFTHIKNAGWHLTYIGNEKHLINKFDSIVEGKYLTEKEKKEYTNQIIAGKGLPGNDTYTKILDIAEVDFPLIHLVKQKFSYMLCNK